MKALLATLLERKDLTKEEAASGVEAIINGADPCQAAAFLVLLKSEGETAQEVEALRTLIGAHRTWAQYSYDDGRQGALASVVQRIDFGPAEMRPEGMVGGSPMWRLGHERASSARLEGWLEEWDQWTYIWTRRIFALVSLWDASLLLRCSCCSLSGVQDRPYCRSGYRCDGTVPAVATPDERGSTSSLPPRGAATAPRVPQTTAPREEQDTRWPSSSSFW